MKNKKNLNKEQIWRLLFLVIPVSFVLPVSMLIVPEGGITSILISAVLGGVGALVGMLLFESIKNKPNMVKGGVLSAFFLTIILTAVGVKEYSKPMLVTCEVCGYKAIIENTSDCDYCASETWEVIKTEGDYTSEKEWLYDEQMFWFYESDTNDVDFYGPPKDDGFEKDVFWEPFISMKDIYEMSIED